MCTSVNKWIKGVCETEMMQKSNTRQSEIRCEENTLFPAVWSDCATGRKMTEAGVCAINS